MLTVHIREFCQVSLGPLPHSVCGPGYEARKEQCSSVLGVIIYYMGKGFVAKTLICAYTISTIILAVLLLELFKCFPVQANWVGVLSRNKWPFATTCSEKGGWAYFSREYGIRVPRNDEIIQSKDEGSETCSFCTYLQGCKLGGSTQKTLWQRCQWVVTDKPGEWPNKPVKLYLHAHKDIRTVRISPCTVYWAEWKKFFLWWCNQQKFPSAKYLYAGL